MLGKKLKRIAIITPFILVLFSFTIVCLAEFPLIGNVNAEKKQKRAAIAIRDDVILFQKFGSKLFTLPSLGKYYEEVYYFTEYAVDDKKEEFLEGLKQAINNYVLYI